MSASSCPYEVGAKFDLGQGVQLELTGRHGREGVWGGVLSHVKGEGRCEGYVHFDLPDQWKQTDVWQVHSWNPLHLEPSFLCHCGFHGFIRAGKWVAA
jgi:hypothetical protein